jgi:hypothetical protein
MITINSSIEGQNTFFSPTSLSQILTTSSKIDIVFPTTQGKDSTFPFGVLGEVPFSPIESNPDLTTPRLPGLGKGRVLRADTGGVDASLELGI